MAAFAVHLGASRLRHVKVSIRQTLEATVCKESSDVSTSKISVWLGNLSSWMGVSTTWATNTLWHESGQTEQRILGRLITE